MNKISHDEGKGMKKMNENMKVTLTLKQLKRLVKEARKSSSRDFEIEDGVLVKYHGEGGKVVIPDGVTSIGRSAFSGCRGLTSVTIPNSVTKIGVYAFGYCSGLTSLTISDGVRSIGESAFDGCSALTSITIPDSVTSIDRWAFWECSKLKRVEIPDSVTYLGYFAFNGCSSLEKVKLPSGLFETVVKYPDEYFKDTPWAEKVKSGKVPKKPKPKAPLKADPLKSFVEQFKDKEGVANAYVSKAGNPCIGVSTWDVSLPEEYVDFWYSFKCRRTTNGSTERWVPRGDADRELVDAVESVLGRFPFVTHNTPDGIDTLVFVLDFRDLG